MPTPFLHSAHSVDWGAWHFEPTVVAGMFIVCSFYLYFALRRPSGFDRLRAVSFLSGATILFVALVSPLDAAADRLLSMHMLQHVALTTLGPPLVLLGLPPDLLEPVMRSARLNTIARNLTNPLVTGSAFIVNMWFWHAPPVYEAALEYTAVHATMHIAFMTTGLLFWWPIIQPLGAALRIGYGARLLYLFVTGFPMGLLALMLIASGSVVYPFYDSAEPLFGISPIEDQQIAGLIMGALGEFASFIAITLIFLRFLDQDNVAETAAPVASQPGSR